MKTFVKTFVASAFLAALLTTSTAFAFTLPDNQPSKQEPEGPDIRLHQTSTAQPERSWLDGIVIG